ncbi:hypothetical protein NOM01_06480 [Sporolactobacillus sp. STSJ-5]|uniref:hypothetical protein n=1 Tax=Sporolactobacillus sp. STSJ-5 TaxID=2965076 RepID=UPI002104E08A|nr:hypothetical protein [Sporolactobacillus sp. STSJ-5]MCQ2009647.1 hypothetical protein [Sporolactobacillus sp. STSJ-5]
MISQRIRKCIQTCFEKINKVQKNPNDKDLVELAGQHAYLEYTKDQVAHVNGKQFAVRNIIGPKENETGLNAMTVYL